jgi:hypothetical protein
MEQTPLGCTGQVPEALTQDVHIRNMLSVGYASSARRFCLMYGLTKCLGIMSLMLLLHMPYPVP